MTAEDIRARLSVIEPTDRVYAGLTDDDVTVLEQLLGDPEDWIAGRAAFALSRVGTPRAVDALVTAANDPRPAVRVSVAAAVGQQDIALPDAAVSVLLQDADPAVRRFAPLAVKASNGPRPREQLRVMTEQDGLAAVREVAADALRRIAPR